MSRVFVYQVRSKNDGDIRFHSYIIYDVAAHGLFCINDINPRAARRVCREKLQAYKDNYIIVWREDPIDLTVDEITNTRLMEEIRRREIIR